MSSLFSQRGVRYQDVLGAPRCGSIRFGADTFRAAALMWETQNPNHAIVHNAICAAYRMRQRAIQEYNIRGVPCNLQCVCDRGTRQVR